jgi:hypothetical protein
MKKGLLHQMDQGLYPRSPQLPLCGLFDGTEALAAERDLRAGQSPASRP